MAAASRKAPRRRPARRAVPFSKISLLLGLQTDVGILNHKLDTLTEQHVDAAASRRRLNERLDMGRP